MITREYALLRVAYTMEYNAAVRKDETLQFVSMCMEPEQSQK